MATTVKYDGNTLSPTPFVSRSYEPLDYGKRFGLVETFELRGTYLPVGDYTQSIKDFTTKFTGQFRNFNVVSNGNTIINEDATVVEEISFDKSLYRSGENLEYSVTIKSYHVPSGVVEPSNEYSFEQGEDGVVSVTHKISAKGIRTQNKNALQNAIDFVGSFVGQNPYQFCNPVFIDNSSGILFSRNEAIDRLAQQYSVTEIFKYNTGVAASQSYVTTHSLDVSEGLTQDYSTVEFSADYKGSTIDSNLAALRSSVTASSFAQKINTLYGFNTSNFVLNTFSVNETSGANSISVKAGYISGAPSDLTGFFSYEVNLDVDEIFSLQTYSLNGSFLSKGPIGLRRTAVSNFKNSINKNYTNYAFGLITGSALYASFKDSNHPLCPQQLSVQVTENTGLANLSISASFDNRDFVGYAQRVDYKVSVDSAKPVMKLIPSATIEGHYVIQDLQCLTQEKTNVDISTVTSGNNATLKTSVLALRDSVSSVVSPTNTRTAISSSEQSGRLSFGTSDSFYSNQNIPMYVTFYDTVVGQYIPRSDGEKFGY